MPEKTLIVRFNCASSEHSSPDSIPVAASDSTVLRNLDFFVTQHVHKENDAAKIASDRAALSTALTKFFSEVLPAISEILVRRNLTFALEIRDAGPLGDVQRAE
jgi:hypothetical protein